MLDLAKIESGRAEWQVTRVDVREVIAQTLAGMSQVFKEKNVRIETRLPERVPPVNADLDRLVQVLLNLLSNALKFCAEGSGRVEVALTEADGDVRIDVRDNGPGIKPEDQAMIFDKFRQAGDTLTDKPPGTGLGLHISRQIVEHFGGRMWVESRTGEGACFSFTLPVAPAPAARRRRDQGGRMAEIQAQGADRRRRAEHRHRARVPAPQQRLRRAGRASNGEEALALVESYLPDLVLLDIMMPVKSGYEVCQRMRERPEWRHIKIVMLSAKGREAEVSKGLSLGADLYITKPFSTEELIAAINGFFDKGAKPDGA